MFGEEFFPTPAKVALTMLARISKDAKNFLDPSAGKGDLADIIKRKGEDRYNHHNRYRIDCIESDPDLVATLRGKEHVVVGHDWLTYCGVSYYDAVLMNPPFSNGDEHLLKAWEFMWDGEIVCLLNQETIDNPYTERRRRLAEIIREHGDVTPLGQCFTSAQRTTNVSVAMVYLRKKSGEEDLNDLWKKDGAEKVTDESAGDDELEKMLATPDVLGNLEHYYNMANEHMMKGFNHLRKASIYMSAGGFNVRSEAERQNGPSEMSTILGTAMSNVSHARAEWGPAFRRGAWMSVFEKMQFHKWLDSKQQAQFLRDVQKDATIPFTADNIKGTLENIVSQRKRLFEQSCANVFDELTSHFHGNTVSEGWKTNDSFKVNEKMIFPYGVRFEDRYKGCSPWGMRWGEVDTLYSDVDRVLCVLNGAPFEKCYTVGGAIQRRIDILNRRPTASYTTADQKTESDHFDIQLYKKGTVHLKFTDRKLWERFNIACAAGKLWLGMNTNGKDEFPGRKTYYSGGKEYEIKTAPMPADPMAMILNLRRQYTGQDEPVAVAPTPVFEIETEPVANTEEDLWARALDNLIAEEEIA